MTPLSITQPVLPVQPLMPAGAATGAAPAGEFSSFLQSAVARVESAGASAAQKMEQFISGESTDLHNVALASQKAALDFEMFLQVRNKVVQAYQEVMRLQL